MKLRVKTNPKKKENTIRASSAAESPDFQIRPAYAPTIPSASRCFHFPRVKSGMSIGLLRFATDSSLQPQKIENALSEIATFSEIFQPGRPARRESRAAASIPVTSERRGERGVVN